MRGQEEVIFGRPGQSVIQGQVETVHSRYIQIQILGRIHARCLTSAQQAGHTRHASRLPLPMLPLPASPRVGEFFRPHCVRPQGNLLPAAAAHTPHGLQRWEEGGGGRRELGAGPPDLTLPAAAAKTLHGLSHKGRAGEGVQCRPTGPSTASQKQTFTHRRPEEEWATEGKCVGKPAPPP